MEVYTIGYEKRSIEEYIEILKQSNVQTIVDVRQVAWSHKRDFCKQRFKNALQEAGIEYIHIKELGNPKEIRRNHSGSKQILMAYKKYLEETQSGISSLLELFADAKAKKQNICLTCFEKDYCQCHRSIITDFLTESVSTKIIHL